MDRDKIERLKIRLHDHATLAVGKLAQQGLEPFVHYRVDGIFLQGSQNYGTDHEGSDVDSKMAITPTYEGLLRGMKFNYDFELPGHEFCSVKPTTDFIVLFQKGNINNLEILTTPYAIVNTRCWEHMRENVELIVEDAVDSMFNAAFGMMNQKRKGLLDYTEGTKDYFDKYGFDNKNLIHILRLCDTLHSYHQTNNFKESMLWGESLFAQNLIAAVKEGITSEVAVYTADAAIKSAESLLARRKGMVHKNNDMYRIMREEYIKSALVRI